MIKYSKILILTISFFILNSCSDLLDVTNYTGVPAENFVNSYDNAQSVVTGAYSGLYGLQLWRSQIYYYLDFASNELEYRHTDGNIKALTNFGYVAENDWILRYWENLYTIISRSNNACSNIYKMSRSSEIMTTLTNAEKAKVPQLIGECNFLRGLSYYYLVRSFGDKLPSDESYDPNGMGIPIVDTLVTTKEQLFIPRNTLQESWNEVIRDFETAYNLLPASWDNSKKGAATKGAAAGYLGQIYMYFKDYVKAKYWFEESIRVGNYKLVDNYAWNFDLEHENNSESIFEVQFDCTSNQVLGNYMWRNYGPDPKWWGVVNVSQEYVDKYSGGYLLTQVTYDDITTFPEKYISLKNPRRVLKLVAENAFSSAIGKATSTKVDFLQLYNGTWDDLAVLINAKMLTDFGVAFNVKTDDSNWGTADSKYVKVIIQASEQNKDPRIYDSFYIPNVDSISDHLNGSNKYLYSNNYYGFKKYIPYNSVQSWAAEGLQGMDGNNSINQRIFRLSDLYLQYAEACYRTGEIDVAKEYLNRVRRRAWKLPIYTTSIKDFSPSEGEFMDALVKEREKELCLEGVLFFDYRRLGLDRTMSSFSSRGYVWSKHRRLPIPLAERQIVGMDILKQNDGY